MRKSVQFQGAADVLLLQRAPSLPGVVRNHLRIRYPAPADLLRLLGRVVIVHGITAAPDYVRYQMQCRPLGIGDLPILQRENRLVLAGLGDNHLPFCQHGLISPIDLPDQLLNGVGDARRVALGVHRENLRRRLHFRSRGRFLRLAAATAHVASRHGLHRRHHRHVIATANPVWTVQTNLILPIGLRGGRTAHSDHDQQPDAHHARQKPPAALRATAHSLVLLFLVMVQSKAHRTSR